MYDILRSVLAWSAVYSIPSTMRSIVPFFYCSQFEIYHWWSEW